MYIRRKVFSLAVDQETGEEKLFSTTDIQSQKEFSEKKKMSKEEFEKEEKDIKDNYKKGLGHSVLAGMNAGIAYKSLNRSSNNKQLAERLSYDPYFKHTAKKLNKDRKLTLAAAGVTAIGAGYHAKKAKDKFKEGYKKAQDKRYQEKLEEEIERQNKQDDKDLKKLEKAEKTVKDQKKKLGIK